MNKKIRKRKTIKEKNKTKTEYPNLEDVMKVINDKKKTAQIMNLDKIINKVKKLWLCF